METKKTDSRLFFIILIVIGLLIYGIIAIKLEKNKKQDETPKELKLIKGVLA